MADVSPPFTIYTTGERNAVIVSSRASLQILPYSSRMGTDSNRQWPNFAFCSFGSVRSTPSSLRPTAVWLTQRTPEAHEFYEKKVHAHTFSGLLCVSVAGEYHAGMGRHHESEMGGARRRG